MSHVLARYEENRSQRSPCLLVADLCASAAEDGGEALQELNAGLGTLREALQAQEDARDRIELSIVDAGGPGQDASMVQDWVDAAKFAPEALAPGRMSHLAQAMRLALQCVEAHQLTLRRCGIAHTRPWIMVVSRGLLDEPPDLWENVARDCLQAERQKRCVIFPILVDGGSGETLQKVATTRVARMASRDFAEYFRWLAASLAAASSATPGEPARLPPARWASFPTA